MEGVAAAVFLSPQTAGMDAGLPGYVALLDAEGGFQLIETHGMDSGLLEYAEGTLHFSDHKFDYALADELVTIPSPKPNLQQALYPVGSAGKVVGLYNDGFTDNGYNEIVIAVDATEGRSIATNVEGAYWLTSLCDETVYGVAALSGDYLTGADRERFETGDGQVGQMLTQIFPGDSERLVATTAVVESTEPSGSAPCVDGVLHYPSFNITGGASGSKSTVVKTWDTMSGAHTETPVITASGEDLALTIDDVLFAKMVPNLVDGDIVWMLADGRVLGTNPVSGITQVLASLDAAPEGSRIFLEQRGEHLWTMTEPKHEHPDLIIHETDLTTGTTHEILRSPDFGKPLSIDLIVRDFVVID